MSGKKREHERKYLINDHVFQRLLKNHADHTDTGMIQWYLNHQGETPSRRIRLEVLREKDAYRHIWTYTEKVKIDPSTPEKREETEEILDFFRLEQDHPELFQEVGRDLSNLVNYPSVMKVRTHITGISNVKVTVDRFLTRGDHPTPDGIVLGNPLMEVELLTEELDPDTRFVQALKEMGLGEDVEECTRDKRFENEFMAYEGFSSDNSKVNIHGMIQFLQNWLKGPVVVVASQGLSVISNLKNTILRNGVFSCVEAMKKVELDFKLPTFQELGSFLSQYGDIPYKPNKDDLEPLTINEIWKNEKKELISYTKVKRLCAELDSIYKVRSQGYQVDEVKFLVFPDDSKTVNGKKVPVFSDQTTPLVYRYLEYLVHRCFPDIKVSMIPSGFSPNNSQKVFESFKEVWGILDNLTEVFKKEGREMILDNTGGHKIIGIIAALYAQFNQMPFYYIQAGSDLLFEFPPSPIQWDFSRIDDDHPFYEKAEKRVLDYAEYIQLPQSIKDLFHFLPIDDGQNIVSLLPIQEIMKQYKEARKMPFGYGSGYLRYIDNPSWRDWIREKTFSTWSLQWIGDQIPETVEHSQRHSKRLMEFATNLIRTMGLENFTKGVPESLQQEFLFVLGVAMNIHDLGHTNNVFHLSDQRSLYLDGLPGVVRDLHHMLTVQMLNHPSASPRFKLLDGMERLFKSEAEYSRIYQAIILVCQYHRGFMPIDPPNDETLIQKAYIDLFDLDIQPLHEILRKMPEIDSEWAMMIMAAARWLKFIDSTDIQADRTLIPQSSQVRCERTQFESLELIDEYLYTIEENHQSIKAHLKKAQSLLHRLIPSKMNPKIYSSLEEIGKVLEKRVYEELTHSIYHPIYSPRIKVPHVWRILARIAFKIQQFSHFDKHKVVQNVYPRFYNPNVGEDGNGNWEKGLTILYQLDPEAPEESRRLMEEVLKDENKEVNKEFKDSGISMLGSITKLRVETI